MPPEGDYLSDPWFRKVITLQEKPRRATIYVASVGYHELYVNGKKLTDDVLSPSVADHTRRARYVTYEIADHLRAGSNVIGLWLGTSWSVYPLYKTDDKPQTPIVIAQAHIEMPDGQIQRLVTDERIRDVDEVFVQADEEVPYGAVAQVLALVRQAGIGKMGLVTDPLTREPR